MEGVMKAIMNFGWMREWTDLLSQHLRVRPEENVEHLSHDVRSKIESDISVYTTVQHNYSLSYLERGAPSAYSFFFNINFNIISTCVLPEVSYFSVSHQCNASL